MNYVVLDMEWNQPMDAEKIVKEPLTLYGEIVQIGAVKLDADYGIVDTFNIMVSPKFYKKMHWRVSKLTGITNKELKLGSPFPDALGQFREWCGDDFVFLTWGPSDIEMLRCNMLIHDISTDWLPDTYDLQIIFDNQVSNEHRQISLSEAVERVGEIALDAHDALNDAKNTAIVCKHLDMARGLAEYVNLENQLKPEPERPGGRAESSRSYKTVEEALADPEFVSFNCPICGETVTCIDFIKQNYFKRLSVVKCNGGHELFVRFKFKKHRNRRFSGIRIIYETDDEIMSFYESKKQKSEAVSHEELPLTVG